MLTFNIWFERKGGKRGVFSGIISLCPPNWGINLLTRPKDLFLMILFYDFDDAMNYVLFTNHFLNVLMNYQKPQLRYRCVCLCLKFRNKTSVYVKIREYWCGMFFILSNLFQHLRRTTTISFARTYTREKIVHEVLITYYYMVIFPPTLSTRSIQIQSSAKESWHLFELP